MNGATAEPEVSTISPPSRTNQIMIGKSQNFFRSFINDQRSIKNSPIETSKFCPTETMGTVGQQQPFQRETNYDERAEMISANSMRFQTAQLNYFRIVFLDVTRV
jgi:hypothetical protein